jgi:hypothetical protein
LHDPVLSRIEKIPARKPFHEFFPARRGRWRAMVCLANRGIRDVGEHSAPALRASSARCRTGRVLAIVAVVFMIVIGALLALAGSALMVTFGSDGKVGTAKQPARRPPAASGLFLGILRLADADRYLSGTVDQATDFELNPHVLTLARRAGAQTARRRPSRTSGSRPPPGPVRST